MIGIFAFFSEFLDSALGMGYGTIMAPILLIMGYDPMVAISALLFSQMITDAGTCVVHHKLKNVNLSANSVDFKVASIMGSISCLGVLSAFSFVKFFPFIPMYIALIVILMGLIMLFVTKMDFKLNWWGITFMTLVASFNKGATGGGFGPLMMGGQIFSGVKVKNAIGITAFGEMMACAAGVALMWNYIDWGLAWMLTACAIIAVPFSGIFVKKIDCPNLKRFIGLFMIALGAFAMWKVMK